MDKGHLKASRVWDRIEPAAAAAASDREKKRSFRRKKKNVPTVSKSIGHFHYYCTVLFSQIINFVLFFPPLFFRLVCLTRSFSRARICSGRSLACRHIMNICELLFVGSSGWLFLLIHSSQRATFSHFSTQFLLSQSNLLGLSLKPCTEKRGALISFSPCLCQILFRRKHVFFHSLMLLLRWLACISLSISFAFWFS